MALSIPLTSVQLDSFNRLRFTDGPSPLQNDISVKLVRAAQRKITNSADFSVNYQDSAPCNNTAANPLLPGKTCQITVYFDPIKAGAEKASYKVFDNSVGSPQSLILMGTGQ